jgi:hypothetical protein
MEEPVSEHRIETREFVDSLPVKATPEEAHAHLQNLKIHTRKLQQLKDDRRAAATDFNESIKHEEGVIAELSAQDEGVVRKPTRVREDKDFTEGVLRRTRLDTDEVYLERPMTDEERQLTIDGDGGDAEVEKPKRGRRKKGDGALAEGEVAGDPLEDPHPPNAA